MGFRVSVEAHSRAAEPAPKLTHADPDGLPRWSHADARALGLSVEMGAAWDAMRLSARLRGLGVHRRSVGSERPTTGWASLTKSEHTVVQLVTRGMTNREVAQHLFVSPHTVNAHVRHVFTKLGIGSRVELTRIATENEPA